MPDSELARELEITEPAPAATTASPREGLDPSIIKSVGYKLSVNPEDSEKLHSMIARSLPKSRDPEPQNLSDDDEEELHQGLTKGMKELQVSDAEVRFFGKSSGAALVQSALSLREHLDGTPSLHPKFLENRRPEFWTIFPVSHSDLIQHCWVLTLLLSEVGVGICGKRRSRRRVRLPTVRPDGKSHRPLLYPHKSLPAAPPSPYVRQIVSRRLAPCQQSFRSYRSPGVRCRLSLLR